MQKLLASLIAVDARLSEFSYQYCAYRHISVRCRVSSSAAAGAAPGLAASGAVDVYEADVVIAGLVSAAATERLSTHTT